MTKREFDAATKNAKCPRADRWLMARDERDYYRARRCLPLHGSGCTGSTWTRDRLAERSAWRRRNPGLPVLALGSPHRAPAEWRLLGRLPRLPLNREERAALAQAAAA